MTEWAVPGYDALELLGFGASGELWRAREQASGELVALRRIVGGDREAVAAVRRDALVVRSLASPHLVRLRGVTRAGPDDVLVLDHADGGSLSALLRRRGALEPGEVVTAVAPLAEALGQAHAQALVHGRVNAASVLLTADGRPLLDGLGMSRLVAPDDPDDPDDPARGLGRAADVWALGALAQLLLTGREVEAGVPLGSVAPTAPAPLVRAVESALGVDPLVRPTAVDLAATFLAACPALPLQGVRVACPHAAPVPEPAGPHSAPVPRPAGPRWPRPRTALLGGAALLALGLVSAVGWAWGQSNDPQPGTVGSPSVTVLRQPDWAAVLHGLDVARGRAFASADRDLLAEVYLPGSDLWRADADTVAGFARARRTAVGVEHARASVTPMRVTADRAELRVVEALTAYDVLDVAGRVIERRPAAATSTRVLVLVRDAGGWRVSAVLASR